MTVRTPAYWSPAPPPRWCPPSGPACCKYGNSCSRFLTFATFLTSATRLHPGSDIHSAPVCLSSWNWKLWSKVDIWHKLDYTITITVTQLLTHLWFSVYFQQLFETFLFLFAPHFSSVQWLQIAFWFYPKPESFLEEMFSNHTPPWLFLVGFSLWITL